MDVWDVNNFFLAIFFVVLETQNHFSMCVHVFNGGHYFSPMTRRTKANIREMWLAGLSTKEVMFVCLIGISYEIDACF